MWIIVSGRLASGKTTLANTIAPTIEARVVTVSDVLFALSAALDVPTPNRRQLQDLGSALSVDGPNVLGQMLLDAVGMEADAILDGLRVDDVALWLRDQLPHGSLHILYLDAPIDVRRARYKIRGDGSAFEQVDSHTVERAAEAMRSIADCVVNADRPVDVIADEVAGLVSKWRGGANGSGANS